MSSNDDNSGGDDGNIDRRIEAITYHGSNSNVASALPSEIQPRPPRNFNDLLRYSAEVAAASGSQPGSSSTIATLDEGSRRFLEDALKSMTVDVVTELLKDIHILQKAGALSSNSDPAECEAALDHIFEYVDNLDIANDFHKIGGFCVIKPCLESSHSSLRWRGAELIAELCQNNPYCQEKVMETGTLPFLLNLIDTDSNEAVRVKALYAISCLIRDCEMAYQEFKEKDGYSVLLRALQSDIQKLNIKSAFLLTSLCNQKPAIKNDLYKMGYVEKLVEQIAARTMGNEHNQSVEHLLSALLCLLHGHVDSQKVCRKPELQLQNMLKFIIANSDGKDEFREENEYAQSLMKVLFEEHDSTPEADR